MINETLIKEEVPTKTPAAWLYWQLTTDRGRQIWHFKHPEAPHLADEDFWRSNKGLAILQELKEAFTYNKIQNPNSGDKVYRALSTQANFTPLNDLSMPPMPTGSHLQNKAFRTAYKGIHFYKSLQAAEGHWPGDYGGPMFLLPGLIIASHITSTPFPAPHRQLMQCYLLNHQNADGGWGMHIEGHSTMFGTVMQYVSLRILGLNATEPAMQKAQQWIKANGGVTYLPAWGKFYLSVLGAYEWEGNNPLLPELWLLPKNLPIHPGNYWCHSRLVFLPMGYCYAVKFTMPANSLTEELKKELYTQEYTTINWKATRSLCAKPDSYYPQPDMLKQMNKALSMYEKGFIKGWREKGVQFALDYIDAEDEHTNYVNLGPVNQALNSIAVFHAYGKDSVQFKKHVERWYDYLWIAEDGMKMQGYNGSQLWDTVFAAQAMLEGGMQKYFPEVVNKAYHFIDISQVREEVRDREKYFRNISLGGWPFSTRDHGWPITDCSAEGMKTAIMMHHTDEVKEKTITADRLQQAVNVVLSLQNPNGSWASYELTRGPEWLEKLNPAEVFGEIMIDYGYTECTSASVQGLIKFRNEYPDHRRAEIDAAIANGIAYIKSRQLPNGSWYGSWAVCFTYGTWFALDALAAVGETYTNSEAVKRACLFLASKQNTDGGWGESFESCVKKEYIPHAQSQVVNTSWATLSLMAAQYPDKSIIEKGINLIISRQQETGDWAQEGISGVFNHNCMITYTSYRNVFPLWALGRYMKTTDH